jgi:hypothetical protein
MNPPKFSENPVSHLKNLTQPAIYKIGGSVLKKPVDIERVLRVLAEPFTAIVVVSAPSGVSQCIQDMFVTSQGEKVISMPCLRRNIDVILPKVKTIYAHIFGNENSFQDSWDKRVRFFTDEFLPMQNMATSAWQVEVFALAYFGEVFTVEMLAQLAEKNEVQCSVLETQQTIFLKRDFLPLPKDLFASVDIDMKRSFEALASILISSHRKKTPLLVAGFVAKNGLLGWNGSDTTAALLGRFYYETTGQVPRIIFQKDKPFQTSGGQKSVNIEGVTKYSYFKSQQEERRQPFVHPQAIDLLDEPYSLPFLIEVPGNEYHLVVTSCKKLAQSFGGNPPQSFTDNFLDRDSFARDWSEGTL